MNAKARIGIFVALSLFASGYASAVPIVNYSSGVATGISGLNVGGSDYDVSFVFGAYNAVFGTTTPTFLGDSAGADAAANAMMAVLNAEVPSPTIGSGSRLGVLWTVYSATATNFLATQVGYQPSPWQRFGDFFGNVTTDHTANNWGFAKFTAVAAVPEPATLALMALGIAGLGVMRRRTTLHFSFLN